MKLRPLVITEAERASIRRVVEHAERNVVSRKRLEDMIAGRASAPGDTSEFTCVIPVGYRCVYSIEEQPMGVCRHLSISVLGEGVAPSEAAVDMLAAEFGFRGGVKAMNQAWMENIAKNKFAINLVQTKNVS